MGSHYAYERRYPVSQAVFTPVFAPGERQTYSSDRAKLLNTYDNSIAYSDRVLDTLLAHIEDGYRGRALVIFASDHGENLYDDGEHRFGHGAWTEASEFELRIPAFVWANASYRRHGQPLLDRVRSHAGMPAPCSVLYHTLLDLVGVRAQSFDPSQSLASALFQTRAIEYVNKDDAIVRAPDFTPAQAGRLVP
jgi:heptose-I-phosphate ethanolaminephosphotransferase